MLLLAPWHAAIAQPPAILVYGDSLSANFGIQQDAGWVHLMQQRLRGKGYGYRLINASISGETTSGGLTRLSNTLDQFTPQIILIELGANDGLRGLPVKMMHDNLARMIDISRQRGIKVVLIAMQLPPNYGPAYTEAFSKVYGQLSERFQLPIPAFLLDGLEEAHGMFQSDGLHPTAQAQSQILNNVWPTLMPLLEK